MKEESGVWFNQAKESFEDAMYCFEGSRYSLAVYCCHQALEKILKACVVEFKNELPPKSHNLDFLAGQTGLDFPKEWYEDLAEITSNFWKSRYPDFQKYEFVSKEAVEPTVLKTKEVFEWISNKLNRR